MCPGAQEKLRAGIELGSLGSVIMGCEKLKRSKIKHKTISNSEQ